MKPFWISITMLLGCLGLTFTVVAQYEYSDLDTTKYPKNIVLMIGDGMGLTQVSAAMYSTDRKLNLESFSHIGFHKTHSAQYLYTDSAAGATAFSCGVKTLVGAVGLDEHKRTCKTILEEADENGLATGLVVTSSIVHATPAAFVAHQINRGMYEDIADDLVQVDVDFLVGGGKKYFDYRDKDDLDLLRYLRKKGYSISTFLEEELDELTIDAKQNFAYFTANDDPFPIMQGRTYLPYASKLACSYLEQHSKNGFFLMVEGSQIDWGGHANLGDYVVSEALDFDEAIGKVLEFAKADGETLVIVTADHECGGLAINNGSKQNNLKLKFTTNKHTSVMVPVFAYGPQAHLFAGIYENTDIYFKMKKALGFNTPTQCDDTSGRAVSDKD